jgi:hypothetical protein
VCEGYSVREQFYVYLHCKPDGDPFYVGKGKDGRCREFKSGRNKHHRNTVAKYGAKNIGVFVFPRASEREAFDDEILWIKTLRDAGYQLANYGDGGEGSSGCKFTVERMARQREALRGNRNAVGNKNCVGRVLSEETRRKIGASNSGHTRWLGRKHSPEARAKISASRTGKKYGPRSAEARARQSAAITAWWAKRRGVTA